MQEQIRIRTTDGQYAIIGGDFQSMLAFVRDMPGRRFRSDERIWEIPTTVGEIQKSAEAAGFHVTADTEVGKPLRPNQRAAAPEGDRVLIRTTEGDRAITGGTFTDMIAAVKGLPQRKWLAKERLWEIGGPLADIERAITQQGFQLATMAPPAARELPPREDQIHVRTRDGEYWVAGAPFSTLLETIKSLEGRRFVSAEKLWSVPCTTEELNRTIGAAALTLAPFDSGAAKEKHPSQ
jgi:hypothetical protein